MTTIQLFVYDHEKAVINDELLELTVRDGFVCVRYKQGEDVFFEMHNRDLVRQISLFEDKE